tara:strand:- start:42 stop:467 length:426 start_codon:yes stop_codon:yes gene_type:complete
MENKQFQLFKDSYKGNAESKDTKVCSKCTNALPLSYFGPSGGGVYLRAECRSCNNELSRVRSRLKAIHGSPPLAYKCPVCLCNEKEAEGRGGAAGAWVLDHDHNTDTFRGWLCHSCNRALGGFNDNVPRIKRAIKYIEGKL